MRNELFKIAIRYNAVYLKQPVASPNKVMQEQVISFVANLAKLGYIVEENLLHQLNHLPSDQLMNIYNVIADVLQIKNNWNPLVKGWNIPTGETRSDHWFTLLANIFAGPKGDRLACGHLIPFNTFPMERYNGCPFCGTPFKINDHIHTGQGSKLKTLVLWTETELYAAFLNLLQSKTALDATQADTLKTLLNHFEVPAVSITMKETQVLVIDTLKETGKLAEAGKLFQTPVDIMRYLWYKHTGFIQLVQPKVILKRTSANNRHIYLPLNSAEEAFNKAKQKLKLKYTRAESRMVAQWINDLPMTAEKAAELMHPKRAMWVRFIRALRLPEYSRYKDMERLKKLLDVFYNESYEVTAGKIEHFRLKSDAASTFALLQERPGLFSRSLFANMLWFGKHETLRAFETIIDQVPARLLLTLNSYADNYFSRNHARVVKPLGGNNKKIRPNRLIGIYSDEELEEMKTSVEALFLKKMREKFAAMENKNRMIYIDPALYFMPMPVGDRSETIQDLPVALMGSRFPVAGNTIRLFMQWGKGLKKQHLDMDLSCQIAYNNKADICSYYNLVTTGAKHSGDIRSIPDDVGTAEYIDLDIVALESAGAGYVSFVCNAYSNGAIAPNLVIGWMNSTYPMKISEKSGVAYDPSCVQHQVRVTQTLSKGLLFGVLDIAQKEIIWIEQSFQGQTVARLNMQNVQAMLNKLNSKTTVGSILSLKAEAQQLSIVQKPEQADEIYTREWVTDISGITQLLID